VSLGVARGQVLGLLGPNGAGKTTLIRVLAGLLAPDAGEVLLEGRPLLRRSPVTLARLGMVSPKGGLYPQLSGAENLLFFARLQGLSAAEARRRAAPLLERLGLGAAARRPVGQYSQGMLARLAMARALLHEPDILLLDEPVASVDPQMAETLRALMRERAQAGGVVLLSTHLLADAERLCQRAIFLNRRILGEVDLEERRRARRVRLRGAAAPHRARLERLAGVRRVQAEGAVLTLDLDDAERSTPALVADLVAAGAEILAVEPATVALQEDYDRLFGRQEAACATP